MAFQVVATNKFERALNHLSDLVPMIYTNRTIGNLSRRIRECIFTLSENPLIGMMEPGTENGNVVFRRIVIKPYFKIIYYIEGGKVLIYDLWDTRQDPDSLIGRL